MEKVTRPMALEYFPESKSGNGNSLGEAFKRQRPESCLRQLLYHRSFGQLV